MTRASSGGFNHTPSEPPRYLHTTKVANPFLDGTQLSTYHHLMIRFRTILAIGALCSTAPLIIQSSTAASLPLQASSAASKGRFETLDQLLAAAPRPPRSQIVANELMNKYDSNEALADVFIVDDGAVLVALKGFQPDAQEIDGIAVNYIATRYSLRDFDRFAAAAGKANPGVNEFIYDFLESSIVLQTDDQSLTVNAIDRRNIPDDVKVSVEHAPPPTLDAAEGAMLSAGSGCTTGFRVKSGSPPVWRLTSANHSTCGSSWTSVNGVAMTLQGGVCSIDTSIASGSSLGLNVGGNAFGNVQGNPASGSQVYKYGVATGWTYGYRGAAATSTISCAVGVYRFTGGNLASTGGDSGGPYISLVWTGAAYVYQARGTHRGTSNGYIVGVRMGNINAAGFTVG